MIIYYCILYILIAGDSSKYDINLISVFGLNNCAINIIIEMKGR